MSTHDSDFAASTAPAPPPPQPPVAAPVEAQQSNFKNPTLAAFLSLFPGIGNLYNGLYMRGVSFFLICSSMIYLVSEHGNPFFGLAIPFFWIFNMVDA